MGNYRIGVLLADRTLDSGWRVMRKNLSFSNQVSVTSRWIFGWCLLPIVCAAVGCSPATKEYRPNTLHAASLLREAGDRDPKEVAAEAAIVVKAWFGTPDEPRLAVELLSEKEVVSWIDWAKVERCAGPVGRAEDEVERGIYRKHCALCHGISGDGYGSAASLLAPYPRDFRRGTFKFKSTMVGFKPTREDIKRTLTYGIPGTAMPAFSTLNESEEFAEDIDALVEYVRYLAIRGEVERRLITKAVRDDLELNPESAEARQVALDVMRRWSESESRAVTIPQVPQWNAEQRAEASRRGKEWFSSELTACVKCHGPLGNGDGPSQDFDEWTKDWTLLSGIDPKSPKDWKEMKPFGALKPVLDRPRNLAWQSFHGGGSPEDLFRRLVLGIEGTPMPPVARADGSNPGLTDDQIWDLVAFVQSLGDGE